MNWTWVRSMVEQAKDLWYKWIPGWIPICASLIGCAIWVGQYSQSINDRLKTLEDQVKAIQDYMRNDHEKRYDKTQSFDPQSYNFNGR